MKKGIDYFVKKIAAPYPFTLIDVGAMNGIPKKWDTLRDAMKILAFEPDPREFAKLSNTDNVTYFNCLLHEKPDVLPFFISREEGKSSVYRPNLSFLSQFENVQRFVTVEEKKILTDQVRNLDTIMTDHTISDVDFIKLDTEGTELPILKGGRQAALPKIFGIQIEVEFIEKNKDQPLFRHIDEFLTGEGFQLIDLRRQYWKRKNFYDFQGKGQMVFGDALYLRTIDNLAEQLLAVKDSSYSSTKIYKCVLVCLIYRLFDYAVSLINMGFEREYFSQQEQRENITMIKRCAREGALPYFLGRNTLYRIFNKISEKLKPSSYLGWADADRTIGNVKDI